MKEVLGLIFMVLGIAALSVCGIGVTVSIVAWILSLLGIPLFTGAGMLIFKFAGCWLVGLILAVLGQGMVSN
jgi:hypothetical protein